MAGGTGLKAKKRPNEIIGTLFVGRPGFEPGLFWTKTRRVASYTIGHSHIKELVFPLMCHKCSWTFFLMQILEATFAQLFPKSLCFSFKSSP